MDQTSYTPIAGDGKNTYKATIYNGMLTLFGV